MRWSCEKAPPSCSSIRSESRNSKLCTNLGRAQCTCTSCLLIVVWIVITASASWVRFVTVISLKAMDMIAEQGHVFQLYTNYNLLSLILNESMFLPLPRALSKHFSLISLNSVRSNYASASISLFNIIKTIFTSNILPLKKKNPLFIGCTCWILWRKKQEREWWPGYIQSPCAVIIFSAYIKRLYKVLNTEVATDVWKLT